MKKVLWTVSLSNGENVYEEKGDFKTIDGELSPWQRLIAYMAEKGVSITSLSLYSNDGRRWNLPSGGNNPKFHAFGVAPKPYAYKFMRKVAAEQRSDGTGNGEWEDLHVIIEARYEDGKALQVWVDDETGNSWSLII